MLGARHYAINADEAVVRFVPASPASCPKGDQNKAKQAVYYFSQIPVIPSRSKDLVSSIYTCHSKGAVSHGPTNHVLEQETGVQLQPPMSLALSDLS